MMERIAKDCRTKLLSRLHWEETKMLCKFSIPITLTILLNSTMGVVSVMFIGRLGEHALATVGLTLSIFNVTGMSIMHGLMSTAITLFAQTFGSGNKFEIGIELQKALFISFNCCFPCWGIFLCIEPILLAIHVNPLIARMTKEYLIFLMPAIMFAIVANVLEKYIQTQNKIMPPLIIGMIINAINALLHYLALYHTSIGINGSAISLSTSYFMQALLTFGYIRYSKIYENSWKGYSNEMWLNWENWWKLGIPGLAMIALKWWFYESCLMLTGIVGVTELATLTLLTHFNQIIYSLLSLGLGIACSILVGQSLGAGKAFAAKSITIIALFLTLLGMITTAVILLIFRFQVPTIFINDEQIIKLAADCMPYFAIFIIFEGGVGVLGGSIRGAGLQKYGAIIIIVFLYLVAGPVGVSLLFLTNYKLKGLWCGFAIGMVLIFMAYLLLLMKINWQKLTKMAAERSKCLKQEDDKNMIIVSTEILPNHSMEEEIVEQDGHSINKDNLQNPSRKIGVFIVFKRLVFTMVMMSILVTGLVLRLCLPMQKYFGNYCIYENGTFLQITNRTAMYTFATTHNCSIFVT